MTEDEKKCVAVGWAITMGLLYTQADLEPPLVSFITKKVAAFLDDEVESEALSERKDKAISMLRDVGSEHLQQEETL